MDYIRNSKLGYDKDQVLRTSIYTYIRRPGKSFKNELLKLSQVKVFRSAITYRKWH
jgi:hypothetical protein